MINSKTNVAADKTNLQTAAVRRGDLNIYASGTGTLAATDEIDLSFTASGNVVDVYVKTGDTVKAGTLLAQVDDHEAQIEYTQANRSYMELTSPTAIASALEKLAQAQRKFDASNLYLEYLLSPDVLRWEGEIAKAQQTLETAKKQAIANPTDERSQTQIKDTEAYLAFASKQLNDAQIVYNNEYIFENFVRSKNGKRYLAIPTDLEILQARLAVDDASTNLTEARVVYDALVSGKIPENTDISDLLNIQEAQRNVDKAKANLDGTKIFAPIDGTVMSVGIEAGDSVGTDTVITIADLNKLFLDIYMDESDWDKVAAGYEVEITFDSLPDTIFKGKVESVDSELYNSGNSKAVHGIVTLNELPANTLNLPIGASASVDVFSARTENALLVPLEALNENASGEYTVYVSTTNGLEQRAVKIGLQNELYAEVTSGLTDGEIVATGMQ